MRKIEKEMNLAVSKGLNWSKDNTTVSTDSLTGLRQVFLHGHNIATIDDQGFTMVNVTTLSKWPTVTTKSRLRALGANVYTKKGRTYLEGNEV